jgi:hypothetical protein
MLCSCRIDEGKGERTLTVEQVPDARLRHTVGERELSGFAQEYEVVRQALRSSAVGHTYKDLPMPLKRMR